MKALEKAAKDREGTEPRANAVVPAGGAPTPGAMSAKSELVTGADHPGAGVRATRRGPGPRAAEIPPRRPSAAAPTAAAATAQRNAAAAATVIRAGQREPRGGIGVYVSEHPLIVIGVMAALFLLAYGGYVYLQMSNPGLFLKQAPRATGTANRPACHRQHRSGVRTDSNDVAAAIAAGEHRQGKTGIPGAGRHRKSCRKRRCAGCRGRTGGRAAGPARHHQDHRRRHGAGRQSAAC